MVAEDVTTGVSPYLPGGQNLAGRAADGRQGVSCLGAPLERVILRGLVCGQ